MVGISNNKKLKAMQNENKTNVKAIETFQLSINWYGKHKLSPEYKTVEEAHANILPFMKQFKGKFFNVTIVRNTRYVAM